MTLERTLADVGGRSKNRPQNHARLKVSDISAELGDRTGVILGVSRLAPPRRDKSGIQPEPRLLRLMRRVPVQVLRPGPAPMVHLRPVQPRTPVRLSFLVISNSFLSSVL